MAQVTHAVDTNGVVKLVRADPAGLERYRVPSTSP
jgi:hypothetical protein